MFVLRFVPPVGPVAPRVRSTQSRRIFVTKGLSFVLALALAFGVALAPAAEAQGLQTGILSGVVQDPDGLPVPGATVTASSPALQGERSTVTDAIGAYIIRGLPP